MLPSSSMVATSVAPSRTSSATLAAIAACRSSIGPVRSLTSTSRCQRFFTVFGSGTVWKNSRGPTPAGSTTAPRHCDRGMSRAVA